MNFEPEIHPLKSATLPSSDDTNYASALTSLRGAIDRSTRFSDEERAALAAEVDSLRTMAEKLESGRVEIVVFGEISTGKSALINALLGRAAAQVNVQGGWTKDVWRMNWDGAGYRVPGLARSELVLVDTPGLNEVDGAERAQLAHDAASRADIVLFVTDSDLNETEYSALSELAASHKPILLALNKIDLYTPEQRDQLLSHLQGARLADLVEPHNVICTAADPRQVEYVIESPDGSQRSEWRKPSPEIETLRARLLEVLQAEGMELLALNAAMYASDRSDRIAALRVQMRSSRAQATVWSYAAVKAVAVAVNLVPALDVIGGSAVDVTMVATLARVYGIEMTTKNAQALARSILKSAGWVMLSEMSVTVASSIFKGITFGYGAVLTALPQGAAAGYGSYIVGQAARYYFENGASWGDQSPKTVVSRILDQTDKQSVLARLKDEIRKKIRLNPYASKSE